MHETIAVPGVKTIGPYSQAVKVNGFLFVSGQPGIDPATGIAAPTFAEQARQSMANLAAVLAAGGSSFSRVVNTTVFMADISGFAEVNALFAEHFPTDPPARMAAQVILPKGLLISIGCVATVDDTA